MTVETPAVMQNLTYSAEIARRMIHFGRSSGVNGSGDLLASAPASGMSINVATGEILIPGTNSTTQGLYYLRVSATDNEPVATASSTNPRIDAVVATVDDAAYSGSTNDGKVQVVTGTPTAGATLSNLLGAPSVPADSELLGYILVPANSTSVTSGNIQDARSWSNPQFPYGALHDLVGTSVPKTTWTQVSFSTSFNGGGMTTGASSLIIGRPGVYSVKWADGFTSATVSGYLAIASLYQNGSSVKSGSTAYAATTSIPIISSGAADIECAEGDTLSLYLYQNSSGTLTSMSDGIHAYLSAVFASKE